MYYCIEKLLTTLLNLIFPIQCLNCGKEDLWLCKKCLSSIQLNEQKTCPICNTIGYNNGSVCPICQKTFCLDKVFIAAPYENELIQKLIKTFKYNFVKDLAKPIAEIMINYLKKMFLINKLSYYPINVISSPLSKKRLHWRGFNQSELLAQEVVLKLNLNYQPNLIIKKKNTKEQAELNRKDRLNNIKNAFILYKKNQPEISGQSFLLIDDVITTGATLGEMAKVLKSNGAKEVWALVVAKN